ncbi:hypothetical protein SAMN06309944_2211 [Micrococcales bacterium KH10]|nr:hypothetical protein SAMN06309944_2211 [Micrococcales bacterium KH10]
MTNTAVLFLDPTGNASSAAAGFRKDLVAAVKERFTNVIVCTPHDASLAANDVATATLVIAEPGAASIMLDLEPSQESLWILTFPRSHYRDPASKPWVKSILEVEALLDAPRYIVASEEARDQLEAVVSGRRIEVVVLARQAQQEEAFPPVNYEPLSLAYQRPGSVDRWDADWTTIASSHVRASDEDSVPTSWQDPDVANKISGLAASDDSKQIDSDVSIIGSNLNFITQLADTLKRGHVRSIRMQEWSHITGPANFDDTMRLIDTSDTIIAEWIRPNAKWIQEHAPRDRQLIVRGHRYEVTTAFPDAVDMQRYSAAVVITPWVGRELVQKFRWPNEKIVYIPNFIDSSYFYRPKLNGAQFTLGMVGIRPGLKRIDLALDLLRELRQVDARYNLRIRSALPVDYINWSKDAASQVQWFETVHRVKNDPLLRGAVFFDPPGNDMSAWFRQIGVVLSLSDIEGSHVALGEGIASGALGVARRWPGILGLWPEKFVHDSLQSALKAILDVREDGALEAVVQGDHLLPTLDTARIIEAWKTLIDGNVDDARQYFGAIDPSLDVYAPHSIE